MDFVFRELVVGEKLVTNKFEGSLGAEYLKKVGYYV